MDASETYGQAVRPLQQAQAAETVTSVLPAAEKQAGRAGVMVSSNHILFLVTMVVVAVPAAFAFDPLAGALRHQWPSLLDSLARTTTHWGKAQWVLVPTGIVVLAAWFFHLRTARGQKWLPPRSVRICAFMFASTGSAELLSSLLKGLFGRARPELMDTAGLFSLSPISFDAAYLSFPSGHATAVAATCTAIALLWPKTRWFALVAGVWLGSTRIFVGAHYPSDVLVGLVLGAYIAFMLSLVFERYGLLTFPRGLANAGGSNASTSA